MRSGTHGAKQQAAARLSAGTERVILGSDDDFDDDDSLAGDTNADDNGFDEEGDSDHEAAVAAGEEFQRMMEQSPGALQGFSPGLQTDNFTGDVSFEGFMEASTSKPNRTTMERLSSNSYQNRGAYGTKPPSRDIQRHDEMPDHDDVGGQPSTPERTGRSARSTQRKSSQHTTSQFEDGLPSSREIFGLGSKENQTESSEGSFRTQSTVPFTLPNQSSNLPMVVVPPAELISSSGLAGDIDDISKFLQQDIASAAVPQKESSGNLPSTDSNTFTEAPITNAVDIAFGKPDQNLPENSTSSSTKSKKKTKPMSRIGEDDGFETDDPEIGAPKEMYMPRPSRSRGKRAVDDLDQQLGRETSRKSEKSSQKVKRRKTDGDAPDSDPEIDRPRKRRREAEEAHGLKDDVMADTIEVHADSIGVENTVELAEEERQPTERAKKKRGRPRKTEKKSEQKSQDTEDLETQDVSEREEDETPTGKQSSKKRKEKHSKASRQKSQVIVVEDSEDELAGSHPASKSSDQSEDAAPSENSVPEAAKNSAESTEQPAKKPAKRGRKPKNAREKSDDELKEQVIAEDKGASEHTNEIDDSRHHGHEDGNNKTLATRVPLQERPDAANADLTHGAGPAGASQQVSSEKTVENSQLTKGTMLEGQSPLAAGKTPHRVGLSRRMRIAPLLKVIKRK